MNGTWLPVGISVKNPWRNCLKTFTRLSLPNCLWIPGHPDWPHEHGTLFTPLDGTPPQTATGGPYKYMRHPGYVGFIVINLATPLVLGSLWALIPGAIIAVLFIIRTALEDSTLQKELEGYKEYVEKVKYRLIPGIW